MAADPPPAEFEITRIIPGGGVQNIYACGAHLAHTVRIFWENGGVTVSVKPADPARHGCKGHMDGWPAAGE